MNLRRIFGRAPRAPSESSGRTPPEPDPSEPKSGAAGAADVGGLALRQIHAALQIDEQWTMRAPRAFTWIGYRLAQRFMASPLMESQGVTGALVSAQTTVVKDVRADAARVIQLLAVRNFLAVGSAFVFMPQTREIVAFSQHFVHAETLQSRGDDLAAYGNLQLCEAEQDADSIAEVVGGRVAIAEHLTSGLRATPDGILAVVGALFQPEGQLPSQFANADEMASVVAFVENTPFANEGGSADGVCVEVPYGERDTTLIELRSDVQHPWLGTGLAVATVLPPMQSDAELAMKAAALQLRQSATTEGGGQLGAWAVRQKNGRNYTAFCRFVPNALYRPNVILDVALGELNRAVWADRLAFPDLPARSAWPILAERRSRAGGPA